MGMSEIDITILISLGLRHSRFVFLEVINLNVYFRFLWPGEASKWEKITYVAIISSTILAVVNLSKGHPHSEEPPVSFVNEFVLLSLMSIIFFFCIQWYVHVSIYPF